MIKIDLYKEWSIWSPCLGKVVLLAGVSSVGKTAVSERFIKLGFNKINFDDIYNELLFKWLYKILPKQVLNANKALIKQDDIVKIFYGCKVNKSKYEHTQLQIIQTLESALASIDIKDIKYKINGEILHYIWDKVKIFIFSGRNVIIDSLLLDEQIKFLSYNFQYYPIKVILLYCSLENNLKKCFLRNDLSFQNDEYNYRNPLIIVDQYCTVYRSVSSHKMCLNDVVLEKLNKTKLKETLNQLVFYVSKFLSYTCDDLTTRDCIMQIKKAKTLIKKINTSMMLSSTEEVFITSTVGFDYVINSLGEVTSILHHMDLV